MLSVVNWPDRMTGRKEKETDPKVFARGFYQEMIMTVNCRFLKPLDFSNRSTKPLDQATRSGQSTGAVLRLGFQRFMMRPISSPHLSGFC
jgi:hypothetical protein